MEEPSFSEKRTFPRFPISIPISCVVSDRNKELYGHTHDISAIGAGIVSIEELILGTRLDITLEMPDDGEQVTRKATVVWVKRVSDYLCRVGIRLDEPKVKAISIVLRVINSQRNY